MTWFIVWSSLLFVGGLCLGAAWGIGRGEKLGRRQVWARLRARAEERRAARWLDRVRETRGGTVMPYRPPEVITSSAAQIWGPPVKQPAKPIDWPVDPIWDQTEGKWLCGFGCDAHTGINLACPMHGRPEPETDEEFTARLAGWADEIIAAARLAPDPYDQLWSAQ